MKLSSNKAHSASGSKWKKKDRKGVRESATRGSTKCLLTFIAVWWKCGGCRGRGQERELSLCFLCQTASCRRRALIKAPVQAERPLSWWSCAWSSHIIHTWEYLWDRERGPPADTETPWRICESLCVPALEAVWTRLPNKRLPFHIKT